MREKEREKDRRRDIEREGEIREREVKGIYIERVKGRGIEREINGSPLQPGIHKIMLRNYLVKLSREIMLRNYQLVYYVAQKIIGILVYPKIILLI